MRKKTSNGADIPIQTQRGLTIGQLADSVSDLTGQRCTPAMIYNYERHGLLPPPQRSKGGVRQFSVQDVQLVLCIKRWQAEGLALEAIKKRLDECPTDMILTEMLPDLPVDRRTQILEAARVVFPHNGYADTTLQDIAQQAGISSSAIYQYFRSKEDLFLALTDSLSFMETLDQMDDALKEDHPGKDDREAARQVLINIGQAFLDTHTRNAEIVRMFIAESRAFPEVGRRYCRRLIAPVEETLGKFIAVQIERGVFRNVDVKLAVHAFYGSFLNFVVTQNLLQGEDVLYFPKRDRVKKLVDIYLAGMWEEASETPAP